MYRSKSQLLRKPRQPIEGLFCSYSHRVCMQNRLDGYDFCLKHILEDKNAPFKQCGYTSSKSGKRCTNAAPKSDRKEGYCYEHARRAAMMRHRGSRKRKPKETAETLLESLDCYSLRGKAGAGSIMSDGVIEGKKSRGDHSTSKILDYASSSDSDVETPVVDQAWRGDGDSDAESIDSEQEDPLKHTGVYTAEEVCLIIRDKSIRLQSLYIDQFKRLQHVMKEKRRKYVHTHKQEKDALGGLGGYKTDPDHKGSYQKLAAMRRYHQRHGKEALLHRQSKQRRIAVSEGPSYKPPSYPKCIHIEEGTKCMARSIPLSKYCMQHILSDPMQVLYRPCVFGNHGCGQCVCPLEEESLCHMHVPLEEVQARLTYTNEESVAPITGDSGTIVYDSMDHHSNSEVPHHPVNTGTPVPSTSTSMSAEEEMKLAEEREKEAAALANSKNQLLLQHLQGKLPAKSIPEVINLPEET